MSTKGGLISTVSNEFSGHYWKNWTLQVKGEMGSDHYSSGGALNVVCPLFFKDKMMDGLVWLEKLKESFSSTGLGYEDLYELIEAAIARGRTNFPAFIYDASRGVGVSVSEGFFYSLDQDWDDPEDFNEVSFFLGEVETSSLPVPDYVFLMKIAAHVYSTFFPDDGGAVLRSAERLEKRYSKRF